MKKSIYVAAAVLALAACTKESPQLPAVDNTPRVEVDFCIEGTGTRVTNVDPANEVAVNYIQIFSFNADGTHDAHSERKDIAAVGQRTVTLACAYGPKRVYALVNAPAITADLSEQQFLNTSSNLTNNTYSAFVMVGLTNINVDDSTRKSQVVITVKRLVAKVVIQKITRNFEGDFDSFRLEGLSLKHVAGNTNYGLTATPTVWYNDIQNHRVNTTGNGSNHTYDRTDAAVVNMISNYGIGASLANGAVYDTEHAFYCYPNDNSLKYTLLTVEVNYDVNTGTTWRPTITTYQRYYPIQIPVEIEANKVYTITNLILNRIGGEKDDADEIIFEVEVADWEVGLEWEVEY